MNSKDEKHFVFMHRDLQYALPAVQVLEIVELPALLPFHGAMPSCLGNVSHRNHLLPILDPTVLGTRRTLAPMASKTFLVVRCGDALFGLAMDRFVTVVSLDSLEVPNGAGAVPAEDNPFVENVRAFRGNSLILLAIPLIADLVERQFGRQHAMTDREGTRVAFEQALTESERRIFLCARIESIVFCIPVEHVLEVIEGFDVTPLFKMPPMVRGLINLRGQVLACVDLSTDLGLPPRRLEERNQFVVLQQEEAELVLCVDKVTGIRRLPLERMHPADMVLGGEMTRYALGVFEEPDGALFLLSVAAVFDAPPLQPYRRQEG